MNTHTQSDSMYSTIRRDRTQGLVAGLVVLALAVWALIGLVTGSTSDERRRQQATPTTAVAPAPAAATDNSTTDNSSTDDATTDEPTTDEPTTDEPEVDPDPQPEPEPEPDPEPQVPLGGNGDLAPNPTLPPPTCQDMQCVAPVDLHPFEQPSGTLPPGIGLAGAEPAGCSLDCITRAQAFQTGGTTDVDIQVETHTLAYIKIFIDDDEPLTGPTGHPYFPGKSPVAHTVGDRDLSFSATLTDLDESTTYWVIVMATDDQLRTSSMVGDFVTHDLHDNVQVVFAAIDIIYDGDHGRNKGELDFAWDVGLEAIGRNGTYTRSNGDRINLSGQFNSYTHMNLSVEEMPLLQVLGIEQDPGKFCAGEQQGAGTDDECGWAWNSTLPMAFTVADIQGMAPCDVFDVGHEYGEFVCSRIATVQSFGGIPEFSVVVAFRLF